MEWKIRNSERTERMEKNVKRDEKYFVHDKKGRYSRTYYLWPSR
jgi:hypothetical protein